MDSPQAVSQKFIPVNLPADYQHEARRLETEPGDSPRLTAALEYVRRGWALIPIGPDKQPYWGLLPKGEGGERTWRPLGTEKGRATKDEVRRWFRRDPNVNIGVICGKASGGLVVVDFDRAAPGGHYHLPVSPRSDRGAPGRFHAFFHSDRPPQCWAFAHGDVKSEGGYVVLPPSTHPSGATYQWQEWLSPDEAPLAPLPECFYPTDENRRAHPAPKRSTKRAPTSPSPCKTPRGSKRQNILSLASSSPAYSAVERSGAALGEGELKQMLGNEEIVLRLTRQLGVKVGAVGKSFRCVLPGHSEVHPSASLFRRTDGLIVYRDWHALEGREWFTLAEVFAAQVTGEAGKLSGATLTAWTLRLLIKAGVLDPARVEMPDLPAGASEKARRVYEGFRLLLQCKWTFFPDEPQMFAWRFAAAWCDLGERQAGEGIKELCRLGVIRGEKQDGSWCFRPGPGSPPSDSQLGEGP